LSSSQKRSIAQAAGKKEGTMHTLADREHYADFLQDIPAFASCTRNVLNEFVTHGVVKVRCGAGMTLSPHTDEDLNLYILAEGSALLSVGGDAFVTLEPGDYFGRTPSRRHHLTASVVALSEIAVLVINPADIASLERASCRDRHPSKIDWRSEVPKGARRTAQSDARQTVLAS
jgi:CRP-like cAMP-binding protein